jgi:hypothetical protein
MKTLTAFFAAVLVALFAGCSAPTFPLDGPKPDLQLASPQQRGLIGDAARVTFPAGRYFAAYRTKDGTFYQAEGPVFVNGRRFEGPAGVVFLDDGGQALLLDSSRVHPRLDRPLELTSR